MYDITIIGAGVTGCSAAYELAKYKLRVLVIEKGSDVCSGSSRSNSGMLHAGFDPRPGSNMAIYNVRGNMMMDELCKELEVPMLRCGTMIFATNENEEQELFRLKANGDANNVPVSIVRPPELYEMQPDIGKVITAVLWAPTGGMISPYGLVIALSENAAVNGVEFRFNTKALDFAKIDCGWRVRTNKGNIDTKIVINCAGTNADILNNIVSSHKITIIPRHGMNLILDRRCNKKVTTIINETPHDLPGGGHTKGFAVMPSVDGTLVLGCTTEILGDRDEVPSTRFGIHGIIDYFKDKWKLLPIGSDGEPFPVDGVIAYYAGIRAHCTEDDFIIGEAEGAPGFLNAVGIESPGLTAGPAIGEKLRELCLERIPAELNPQYIKGRKAKKAFRTMTREERIAAINENPDYAKIVCRCEMVTEAEVRDAIRRPLGARSLDAVKMRTRAGMGRCQGGFCSPRVLQILTEEMGCDPLDITQCGGDSYVLKARVCGMEREGGKQCDR